MVTRWALVWRPSVALPALRWTPPVPSTAPPTGALQDLVINAMGLEINSAAWLAILLWTDNHSMAPGDGFTNGDWLKYTQLYIVV